MRKLNEILAVVLLTLAAVLVAAIGLRAYQTYIINDQAKQERREQEQVLARNREANDRVLEMRQEIEALSGDRERLSQFLAEIQTTEAEAVVPVSMMIETESGMTGSLPEEDVSYVSGNDVANTLSENTSSLSGNDAASALSENTLSLSENTAALSGNTLSLSENTAALSGNTLSLSENTAALSGNTMSLSENDAVSANELISGNGMNLLPIIETVFPEITLAERRQIRSSLEETLLVNQQDRACLEKRRTDFSGKRIACLGDSITAAANLEGEEGYLSYAYPAVLKELLGAEEVYNLGIGGSSIGRYWSDAFVERYTQIPQDTDIILVMGGTNDGFCLSEKEFGSLAERKPRTFCGDLDELMRGLSERYPDADIYFITPLPNILHDYLMRERAYLLPQKNLADVILTLSAVYEFRVIDLYNANILDSHDADIVADYMPDGVHANKAGYRILAEHIAAELVRHYEGEE